MTAAARAVAADAPVPTCPEWVARDLMQHQGGIHRWATSFVAEARTEPRSDGLEVVVGGWPGDEELADWFEAGYRALVSALEAAPPDLQCWTFLTAPSPLAFWSRRQAHETAIHRVLMPSCTAGLHGGPPLVCDARVRRRRRRRAPRRFHATARLKAAGRCAGLAGLRLHRRRRPPGSWTTGPDGAAASGGARTGAGVGVGRGRSRLHRVGPGYRPLSGLCGTTAATMTRCRSTGTEAVLADRFGDAMGLHWTDD